MTCLTCYSQLEVHLRHHSKKKETPSVAGQGQALGVSQHLLENMKVVMESSGRAGADGRRRRRPRVVFMFVAFCLSTFAMACAYPLVPQVVAALCGGDLSRASLSLGLLSACTPLPPRAHTSGALGWWSGAHEPPTHQPTRWPLCSRSPYSVCSPTTSAASPSSCSPWYAFAVSRVRVPCECGELRQRE